MLCVAAETYGAHKHKGEPILIRLHIAINKEDEILQDSEHSQLTSEEIFKK